MYQMQFYAYPSDSFHIDIGRRKFDIGQYLGLVIIS